MSETWPKPIEEFETSDRKIHRSRSAAEWHQRRLDGCTTVGLPDHDHPAMRGHAAVGFGHGSKRKPGGVIELPYLDGQQWAQFPEDSK
jgi:hypothetical protein